MDDDEVAAAYDARAAEYIALIGSIDQMERDDVARIGRWRDETPGVLLDAGCGPGLWTAFLANPDPAPDPRSPRREVVGVDVSAAFLAAARARHPALRFESASMRELPFPDGSFGGVLAWYSLIHVPPVEMAEVVAELARVLAVGGRIRVGFFDGEPRERFAHAVAPAYYWSAEALTPLLESAGLRVIRSERREREPGAAGSVRPHGALEAERIR
ncbi:class I SAM-dependent methyltransferase [Microbacterium azadirachtae]|uniref:Putative S-adenosylmethionine-dependent methyltransferase n=1 Tax=Microbacterium azadirachtae TaxID=582680 RepID=A0A0F0LKQ1_9MICO|nr:class I SAM-dependent methyltransferase [Microbacterium azadirachtae]KJL32865.1 putative S-adenosylmethionine-dependent methyltransferase [Microbacterium azadirachtae]